jgi:hypothetical protein
MDASPLTLKITSMDDATKSVHTSVNNRETTDYAFDFT